MKKRNVGIRRWSILTNFNKAVFERLSSQCDVDIHDDIVSIIKMAINEEVGIGLGATQLATEGLMNMFNS